MRASIHQPYFLPWMGYLSKIYHSDLFVVLDDVAFRKGHFHNRARIVFMDGHVGWLTIPTSASSRRLLCEVRAANTVWGARMLKTIQRSYAHAPHFKAEWPAVADAIARASREESLCAINLSLIRDIWALLFPTRTLSVASARTLMAPQDRTGRVVELCRALGVTDLVVGTGVSTSAHDLGKLSQHGVRLLQQDFLLHAPAYPQMHRKGMPFVPGLSVIDAIFNIGVAKTSLVLVDPKAKPRPLDRD